MTAPSSFIPSELQPPHIYSSVPLSRNYVYVTSAESQSDHNDPHYDDDDDITSNSISSVDEPFSDGNVTNTLSHLGSSCATTQHQLPHFPPIIRPLDFSRPRSSSSTSVPPPLHNLTPRPGDPLLDDLHDSVGHRSIGSIKPSISKNCVHDNDNGDDVESILNDSCEEDHEASDESDAEHVVPSPFNPRHPNCGRDYYPSHDATINDQSRDVANRPPIFMSRRTLPVAPLGNSNGRFRANSNRQWEGHRRPSYNQAGSSGMMNVDDRDWDRRYSRTSSKQNYHYGREQQTVQKPENDSYPRSGGSGYLADGGSRVKKFGSSEFDRLHDGSLSRPHPSLNRHTSVSRRLQQWSGASSAEFFRSSKIARRPLRSKPIKKNSKGKESGQRFSPREQQVAKDGTGQQRRQSCVSGASANQHSNKQNNRSRTSSTSYGQSTKNTALVPRQQIEMPGQLLVRNYNRMDHEDQKDDHGSAYDDESSVDEEAWIVHAAIAVRNCGDQIVAWGPIQRMRNAVVEGIAWRKWKRRIVPSACRRRFKRLRFPSPSILSREDLCILLIGGFALFMSLLHYRLVQTTWILEERLRMATLHIHSPNPSIPLIDPEVLVAAMNSQFPSTPPEIDNTEFDQQSPQNGMFFTFLWLIFSVFKLIVRIPLSLLTFLLPILWGVLAGIVLYAARTLLLVGLVGALLYFAFRYLLQNVSSIPFLKDIGLPSTSLNIPWLTPSLFIPFLSSMTASTTTDTVAESPLPTTPAQNHAAELTSSPEGKPFRSARTKSSTSDRVKRYESHRNRSTALS